MAPDLTDEYLRALLNGARDYFLTCGSVYVIFYLGLSKKLAQRKITRKPSDSKSVRYEITRTIFTMAVAKAPLAVALAWLAYSQWIPSKLIYQDVSEHSLLYLAGTVVFDFFFFDLWFYLSHRFILHTKFFYKHVHFVHHHSTDPTPFARNSVHPVEGVMNTVFHLMPIYLMPHHPIAILLATHLKGAVGIFSHLGYELAWSGFSRHWLFQYCVTAVQHHLHHSHAPNKNFCFFVNYDLIFGTQYQKYHDVFEETVRRGERAVPQSGQGAQAA